ncbi:unnamed protein product [Diamesa hyperborea]
MDNNELNPNNIVLLNTFLIDKCRYRVFYNSGLLIYEKEKSKKGNKTIQIENIINVKTQLNFVPVTNGFQQSNGPSIPSPSTNTNNDLSLDQLSFKNITINYAKQVSGAKNVNKWRIRSITFNNSDKRIIREWYESLTVILKSFARPKKLLIFVNPYGGKKNAMEIFEKYAKPMFRLADIDPSVIVTQRSNQIFDLVIQQSIDQFDGIVSCGGDGTFSELFNGLIYRKMIYDHSSDSENPHTVDIKNISKPEKPLGIIPAGSTDTVAYCLHGTTDIETCLVHIMLGQTSGLDISSVSNNKGLIKFYASVMSYGYLGDVCYESEKLRWLGPKRYEYSGFKKIIRNRGYEAEISLLQDTPKQDSSANSVNPCDPNNGLKCCENCSICSASQDIKEKFDPEMEREIWHKVRGKFFMVNGANISCACARSPLGMSPYCHIGDGYVDVIVVRHGSLLNNLKLLLKLSSSNGKIADLPFVEIYRTKKFHFKSLNGDGSSLDLNASVTDSTQPIPLNAAKTHSSWNCDGEVLHETDLVVRSHNQLITVYRRGPANTTTVTNQAAKNCLWCK